MAQTDFQIGVNQEVLGHCSTGGELLKSAELLSRAELTGGNSPFPKPYYHKLDLAVSSNAAKVSHRRIPSGPVLHRSIVVHNQLLRVTAFRDAQSHDRDPTTGNPLPPFLVWDSLDGDCRMVCDYLEEGAARPGLRGH